MNMSSCGGASERAAKGDEGDPLGTQIIHHGSALGAIRMKRDIYRLAVIEAELVVRRGLTESTHGQWPPEGRSKKSIHPSRISQRPVAGASIADQNDVRGIWVCWFFNWQLGKLFSGNGLGHQLLGLTDALASAFH